MKLATKIDTHIWQLPCRLDMARQGYEWADTHAAKMLASAIQRANETRGVSVRQLAKHLSYKQAVVLSHMANGKAPIPIDRAEDLAHALEMDAGSFLQAVIEQRHPGVSWSLITRGAGDANGDPLARQLEAILGSSLGTLNAEQRRVMREVASDASPQRRWLSVHELPAYQEFREQRSQDDEIDEVLAELARQDEDASKKARRT